MKAVLLPEHGPPENLQYVTDAPMPDPQPGEVRIKVEAISMNRLDRWVCEGWPGLKLDMPHILGADAAGTIDALGEGVSGWTIGDRVAIYPALVDCTGCEWCDRGMENLCAHYHIRGETTTGTYREYVCVAPRDMVALPDHISFEEGAAAGLVYLTAWHSLMVRAELRPGEHVLIIGASGGVNTASLQIAKMLGCTTYVVGSSDEKLEKAKELGADHLINRNSVENWGKSVYKLTNRRGVDLVVDNVGAPTMMMSIRACRKGGRVVTVGNTAGPTFEFDNRFLFFRTVSLIGSTMGTIANYRDVMQLVFNGNLQAIVGATYSLDDAIAAHHAMDTGEIFGKIVLKP